MQPKVVHIVTVEAVDSQQIRHVCSTYKLALQRWNEVRTSLIKECQEILAEGPDGFYEEMIKSLECEDPLLINNFPYDTPKIHSFRVEV